MTGVGAPIFSCMGWDRDMAFFKTLLNLNLEVVITTPKEEAMVF